MVDKMKKVLMVGLLSVASSSAYSMEILIDFDGLAQEDFSELTVQNVSFSMFETVGTPVQFFDYYEDVFGPDEFSDVALLFGGTETLTSSFENAVSAFSFYMLPSSSSMTFQLSAFDGSDGLVESVSLAGGERFGSLTSSINNISYATLTRNDGLGLGSDTALTVDNFKYTEVSPVPEPSTYALMLGGLGLVGFMAYRRKKV